MEQRLEEKFAGTSLIKMDKMRKMEMLRGAMAVQLAKQANDPLLKKMLTAKKLYKAFKMQIMKKYQAKARTAAMAASKK